VCNLLFCSVLSTYAFELCIDQFAAPVKPDNLVTVRVYQLAIAQRLMLKLENSNVTGRIYPKIPRPSSRHLLLAMAPPQVVTDALENNLNTLVMSTMFVLI
jgi:hypothetical protein